MGQKQIQEFNMILYYDILKFLTLNTNTKYSIKVKNVEYLDGIKHEIQTPTRIITVSYDIAKNYVSANIGNSYPEISYDFYFFDTKLLQHILERWL